MARQKRSFAEQIADLEAKVAAIKERAARTAGIPLTPELEDSLLFATHQPWPAPASAENGWDLHGFASAAHSGNSPGPVPGAW